MSKTKEVEPPQHPVKENQPADHIPQRGHE